MQSSTKRLKRQSCEPGSDRVVNVTYEPYILSHTYKKCDQPTSEHA